MPKFYGKVGFEDTVETAPSVYTEQIIERYYYGDVISNRRRLEKGESINDNVRISNSISIVSDAYSLNHFHSIRYVEWMNVKWKVDSVDASTSPRLILDLGDVYTESTPDDDSE